MSDIEIVAEEKPHRPRFPKTPLFDGWLLALLQTVLAIAAVIGIVWSIGTTVISVRAQADQNATDIRRVEHAQDDDRAARLAHDGQIDQKLDDISKTTVRIDTQLCDFLGSKCKR